MASLIVPDERRIGFVLAGGGARGAFQAGVLYKLTESVAPAFVVGTSVGALNAAALTFGGRQCLMDSWFTIAGLHDVFTPTWYMPWRSGLYGSAPLRSKVRKICKGKEPSVETAAVYCDLMTGQTCLASTKNVIPDHWENAVVASASIPVVVEPVEGRFVDGGCRDLAPLKHCIRRGMTDIIVILCDNDDLPRLSHEPDGKLEVAIRSWEMISNEVLRDDISQCHMYNRKRMKRCVNLMVLEPPAHLDVGSLDFNPVKIREMWNLGTLVGSRSGAELKTAAGCAPRFTPATQV
jgi:NTE family protein